MAVNDTNSHWSSWWQQGHITTFGALMEDNYTGAILRFWLDQFNGLPENAKLLDIAAGNGAIASLAASCDVQQRWRICASDLAAIQPGVVNTDPSAGDPRSRIEFFPSVSCETQPFADASFDLVSSQYGFEYSDTSATLAEVSRILRPGGRFVAIAHHQTSELLSAPRQTIRVLDFALLELGLFDSLEKHFKSLKDVRSRRQLDKLLAKPRGRRHLQVVQQGLASLGRSYPGDETGARIFCCIEDLLRDYSLADASTRKTTVNTAREDFQDNARRLRDMIGAGLSEHQMQELVDVAHQAGMPGGEFKPFRELDNSLVGWQLTLQKS
jgi:ubiquinone/menaquinone biosynthesis C-methylase UbiE